jgi:hypothetical protein
MKTLFSLATAAVALGSVSAGAQQDPQCAVWRHGECAHWMHRHDSWHIGYVFGPDYAYTDYGALPQPYVVRYHLSRRYRYVYSGGNIYVVDPATYAVTRILSAATH